MNIVVFGCDNTGKSSLCKSLANYLNEDVDFSADFIHSPGASKSVNEMMEFMENNLVPEGHRHTRIFDRFPYIEEYIYGNLLRHHNKFDIFDQQFLRVKILNKVDLFIYCYPGLFTTLNWGDREQMEGVKDHALDIISEYNKLAVRLKLDGYNVKEYNYRCDDFRRLLND